MTPNADNPRISLRKIDADNLGEATAMAAVVFPDDVANDDPVAAYREAISLGWPRFAYYIADVDSVPFGITGHYPPDDDTPELWLGWFGVLPEFRRRGLGRQLLLITAALMRDLGQPVMRLWSEVSAVDAHRLYRVCGLAETGCGLVGDKPVVFFAGDPLTARTV